jgi:NAD(P)-dependent dehydrogenase (short-subunit alcohol dehydrogenase family)
MTPIASLLDQRGRVAIVAGGAGAIGGAIAARLRESGAVVYSLDRPGRTAPGEVSNIECDLTNASAVTDAVEHVERQQGRLDIVVHAAGILRDAMLWKASLDDWADVLATNLSSAFVLLRSATPVLRRAGTGAIVLISSINGERAKLGQSAYAASKAGVNALARVAARELGAFNIRVNAIAPGWIETPMTAPLADDLRHRARDESPLGRLGEPDDVARAALFLASDLARHITGQVLRVDGGQLIG